MPYQLPVITRRSQSMAITPTCPTSMWLMSRPNMRMSMRSPSEPASSSLLSISPNMWWPTSWMMGAYWARSSIILAHPIWLSDMVTLLSVSRISTLFSMNTLLWILPTTASP